MLIGYARVSTLEQNLDLQEDALKAAGCKKIYTDKTSGTKAERPGLERALADVRPGDSLVVWKLDRLGRSLKHLIETVTDLSNRGVGFQSLQEAIDTKTSRREARLPCLRGLGRVRAGHHPGADPRRPRRRAGAWEEGRPAPQPRRQEEAARRDAPRRPDELREGHLPDAGDLEGDALSVSGRAATP